MHLYLIREPRTIILVATDSTSTPNHSDPSTSSSSSSPIPDLNCLVFRNPPDSNNGRNGGSGPSVVVELLPLEEVEMAGAVLLYPRGVFGCLGVLRLGDETFLPIITAATSLGSSSISSSSQPFTGLGAEPISRILGVEFFCLSSAIYDSLLPLSIATATIESDYDIPDMSGRIGNGSAMAGGTNTPGGEGFEHPCAGIRKILSNSFFYYSSGEGAFDLSTRLEARVTASAASSEGIINSQPGHDETLSNASAATQLPSSSSSSNGTSSTGPPPPLQSSTPHFLWNSYLLSPLLEFASSLPPEPRAHLDRHGFLVRTIQGYVGVLEVPLGGGGGGSGDREWARMTVVSRLGWKRAGTRFNVRGVDDEGWVANFVETETILRTRELCFSYTQVRGSVPLFWEESGQPFAAKIALTRPLEASLPSFLRHFDSLLDSYSNLHLLNLLSLSPDSKELVLTQAYEDHLEAAAQLDPEFAGKVKFTNFDFHAKSRAMGMEGVRRGVWSSVGGGDSDGDGGMGSCVVEVGGEGGRGNLVLGQKGVFRTNCKDCLDRTNFVQDVLSRYAIEEFLANTNPIWSGANVSALWAAHRTLFAENGDALSKIYVGTGAINTSYTRSGKKSFAGMLSDATKSVGRMYQSNFIDNGKQRAIDTLLGHLPTSQKIRVFNPINDALHASLDVRSSEYTSFEPTTIWVGTYNLNGKGPSNESLLPWLFPNGGAEPSFLVIAFQEIVPLTPQMIMATDPEKKRRWEAHIFSTVASRPGKKEDYILLRSGQLVGTALIVLVKTSLANEVRNVEAATKKTGLKGMAGNKGAVAIRLDFRDTSLCFLTAHLAAGHANLEERNSDYFTIAEGLHFSKGKTLQDHENVIWAADTNYRISLPNQEVRRLAVSDEYAALAEGDQLLSSMQTRGVFSGYTEGPLLFRPTYKYDNGTDVYDSSEKQRVPAWTDRILYRGAALDLSRYQRTELMASDHRPVYAIFRANIKSVDPIKKKAVREQILHDILAREPSEKIDTKMRKMLENSSTLPPPSDDKQTWWDGDDPLIVLEKHAAAPPPMTTNPFDLPPRNGHANPPSPSVSANKPAHAIRRKPPPVPRPVPVPTSDQLLSVSKPSPTPYRLGGTVRRSTSATSLLDSDDGQSMQSTGGWEVIEASKAPL